VCDALEPLADKYASFGWHVAIVHGNAMEDILDVFGSFNGEENRPTVIIADVTADTGQPSQRAGTRSPVAGPGSGPTADPVAGPGSGAPEAQCEERVALEDVKESLGRALERIGVRPEVVVLGPEPPLCGTGGLARFYAEHPERRERYVTVSRGAATSIELALGLAREGKVPILVCEYPIQLSEVHLREARVNPVKIIEIRECRTAGMHTTGDRAAVVVPCDAIEAESGLTEMMDAASCALMRCAARLPSSISGHATPYRSSVANVLRFRGSVHGRPSFDICSADMYESEQEKICILGAGPVVASIMEAAVTLEESFGIETRVLEVHTLVPLDTTGIESAYRDTGAVIVLSDYLSEGLGEAVVRTILEVKEKGAELRLRILDAAEASTAAGCHGNLGGTVGGGMRIGSTGIDGKTASPLSEMIVSEGIGLISDR
jgi:transketolase